MATGALEEPTPRLLTIEQVAELCQVSTKTVYRAIRSGALKACRLGRGGAYRVKPEEMENWIEACSSAARTPPRSPARKRAGELAPRTRAGRRIAADGRLTVAPDMGRTS